MVCAYWGCNPLVSVARIVAAVERFSAALLAHYVHPVGPRLSTKHQCLPLGQNSK
jgi:hypothetical protein